MESTESVLSLLNVFFDYIFFLQMRIERWRIIMNEYHEEYHEDQEFYTINLYTEFDNRGNCTYERWNDGHWERYEYDEKNRVIYKETSEGSKRRWEFDIQGNCVYTESETGRWDRYEFDNRGNFMKNISGNIYDNDKDVNERIYRRY